MNACLFTQTSPGHYTCTACGREVVSTFTAEQLHYRCTAGLHPKPPRTPTPPPDVTAEAGKLAEATGDQSLIALGIRYARALVRWGKAGFPTRTDEEVAAIVATCQTEGKCYDPDRKTCRVCGCCVGTKGLAVRNKAKMGTEHCPRKMW